MPIPSFCLLTVIVVVDLGGVLKWVQPFHKQKCQLFRNEMVTLPVKKSLTKGCFLQDVFLNDGDIVELQTCVFVGRGKNGSIHPFWGMVHLIQTILGAAFLGKNLGIAPEQSPNNLFWLAKGSGSAWPPFLPAASRENLGHPFTPSTLGPVPGSHDICTPCRFTERTPSFQILWLLQARVWHDVLFSQPLQQKRHRMLRPQGLRQCAQGIQPAPPAAIA